MMAFLKPLSVLFVRFKKIKTILEFFTKHHSGKVTINQTRGAGRPSSSDRIQIFFPDYEVTMYLFRIRLA